MPGLTELVVSRLREIGVPAIFGVPGGGGNLDLIEAAGRAGLPFVLTATETAAAIAALAQTEVTGRPGACLATLGPGAASLVNGVACAHLDRAPVLVFTDSHPDSAGGAWTHQQIDQQSLFAPVTKWSGRLSSASAARTLDDAIREVMTAPPGPVHLDWPGDATAEQREARTGSREPSTGNREPSTENREPRTANREPSTANRPVLIAGLGARSDRDVAAIRALCERHRIPAFVTYKGKGIVPDDHPCFAGVFTNAAIERPLVSRSDLIIGAGLDPVELLPRAWPYEAPVVYLGRWRVSDAQVPFAAQSIGEVADGVAELDAGLSGSEWTLDEIRAERTRQRSAVDVPADGLTAQRVVQVTAERFARASRVTVDAGAHMVAAVTFWPAGAPNRLLISNGLSTMGFALPAAIGAALADRSEPVVALTGDGGLLMCVAELATAVREKLRVVTVVFDDASLSLIEIKQQHRQYRPSGVALGPIDWRGVAAGFGVMPFVARDERELRRALEGAADCAGPSLIAARVDRSNYARTFQAVRG